MNHQHTLNALTTQSSQDHKLGGTTNLWQLYWDKNTQAQIRFRNDR